MINTNKLPLNVDKVEEIPEQKAGLKSVYILDTDEGRSVYSEDTGKGWNWFSGDYVEPLIFNHVDRRDPGISPSVISYDIDDKWMITDYIGDRDLEDSINYSDHEDYELLGELLGHIHSLNTYERSGGFKLTKRKTIEPQHTSWNETIVDLLTNSIQGSNIRDSQTSSEILSNIKHLDTDDVPLVLSHGDFHPRNIRIHGNGEVAGIVDWQNAWVSDGLNEFFYTRHQFLESSKHDKNIKQAFTKGYCKTCPSAILDATARQASATYVTALMRLSNDSRKESKETLKHYTSLNDPVPLERILFRDK